jgi:hypothetical protein
MALWRRTFKEREQPMFLETELTLISAPLPVEKRAKEDKQTGGEKGADDGPRDASWAVTHLRSLHLPLRGPGP